MNKRQGGPMDSYAKIEEQVFSKMLGTFTHRFNMEQTQACELALELVEVLSASDTNLTDFDCLIFS